MDFTRSKLYKVTSYLRANFFNGIEYNKLIEQWNQLVVFSDCILLGWKMPSRLLVAFAYSCLKFSHELLQHLIEIAANHCCSWHQTCQKLFASNSNEQRVVAKWVTRNFMYGIKALRDLVTLGMLVLMLCCHFDWFIVAFILCFALISVICLFHWVCCKR